MASMDAVRGSFPGRARPLCVRARRIPGACKPRTGTDGGGGSGVLTAWRSGLLTVLLGVWSADLAFQDACSLSSSSPPGPDSGSVMHWLARSADLQCA